MTYLPTTDNNTKLGFKHIKRAYFCSKCVRTKRKKKHFETVFINKFQGQNVYPFKLIGFVSLSSYNYLGGLYSQLYTE